MGGVWFDIRFVFFKILKDRLKEYLVDKVGEIVYANSLMISENGFFGGKEVFPWDLPGSAMNGCRIGYRLKF